MSPDALPPPEEDRLLKAQALLREALARGGDVPKARVLLADLHRFRGETREAAVHYTRALEADPACVQAWLNFALLNLESGELENAELLVRRALKLDPSLGHARQVLAEVLLAKGRLPEALREADQALERSPGSSEFQVTRAKALARLGDREGARRAVEGLFALDESLLGVARILMESLIAEGSLLEASKIGLRRICLVAPEFIRSLNLLHAGGLRDRALDSLAEALLTVPDTCPFGRDFFHGLAPRLLEDFEPRLQALALERPKSCFALAEAFMREGRFPAAQRLYARCLELDDHGAPHRLLAARLSLGRHEAAFQAAEAAPPQDACWPWSPFPRSAPRLYARALALLDADGKAPPLWRSFYRGLFLDGLGRSEEALGEALKLREAVSGPSLWLRVMPGLVCADAGDLGQARRDFEAALAARPGDWWLACRLAELLVLQGEAEEGLRRMRAARVEASPAVAAKIAAWEGRTLLRLGDCAKAFERLDFAVERGEDSALAERGGALLALGRLEEAERDLARAVFADPAGDQPRVRLAELQLERGLFEKASSEADVVLRRRPDHPWALRIRKLAEARGKRDGELARHGDRRTDPHLLAAARLER